MPLNCSSLPLMIWKKDRGLFFFFFFNLGFLAKGTGLSCFVLALATFSSHALLAVQAWYKTLHAEIIFRFAAGLVTAVI